MAEKQLECSYVKANQLMLQFEKLGLLKETTGWQRNRRYKFWPYLALFEERPVEADQSKTIAVEAGPATDPPMDELSGRIRDLMVRQVEEHGIAVWYDPDKHYGKLVQNLALPETETLVDRRQSPAQVRRRSARQAMAPGEG